MNLNVEHNEAAHKYSAQIDGHEAVATYVEDGDSINFTHTVVDPALRGKGVGEELVRQALADARKRGRRIEATCPFVVHYLEKHPEERA